ncbi:uncharacterized protein G2W53_028636 [Senna tora]|uniref:Uncharacterized protein n=1 Tax=Senna tora TaxID=362788 RepID=A0A834T6B0_9FABA|nr:uncharacterized protein G2W53_028636 [Senna tora]
MGENLNQRKNSTKSYTPNSQALMTSGAGGTPLCHPKSRLRECSPLTNFTLLDNLWPASKNK